MMLTEAIAKRVKGILSERNMTQYKLFIVSGVPQTTISSICKAEYPNVKLNTILNLCRGLNMELEEFFRHQLFHFEMIED